MLTVDDVRRAYRSGLAALAELRTREDNAYQALRVALEQAELARQDTLERIRAAEEAVAEAYAAMLAAEDDAEFHTAELRYGAAVAELEAARARLAEIEERIRVITERLELVRAAMGLTERAIEVVTALLEGLERHMPMEDAYAYMAQETGTPATPTAAYASTR